jgi:ketosteroid isomerase-like protein
MTDTDNTALVQSVFDAWERGDLDSALEVFADDVTVFIPGPDAIPFAGHHKGKDSVREYFAMLPRVLEIDSFTIHSVIAQGDKVVVNGHETGVAKETGKRFANHWVMVWTFADGLVTDVFEYHDTAALAEVFTE